MMDTWPPSLFQCRNPVSYYAALKRGRRLMETASAWLGMTRRRPAKRAVRLRVRWTVVGRIEAMTALGLALLVVAVVLLLAEAHLSTGGLIGAGASAAAIGGAALLLLAAGAGAGVVLIVALCTVGAAIPSLLLARRRILRPIRARPRTGREALVGHVGVVRSSGGPRAQVFVDGSLWRAEANPVHEEPALHDGDRVVIERVNGLTLCVRRAEEWELNP
jgi:membrane protein implicated in regulation of membrane protease activity